MPTATDTRDETHAKHHMFCNKKIKNDEKDKTKKRNKTIGEKEEAGRHEKNENKPKQTSGN